MAALLGSSAIASRLDRDLMWVSRLLRMYPAAVQDEVTKRWYASDTPALWEYFERAAHRGRGRPLGRRNGVPSTYSA
jgi:hypothetical protein